MRVLLPALTIAGVAASLAALPLPTPAQLWYQTGEIHALIHFNMATFAKDGDPGCQPDNWNTKVRGSGTLTSKHQHDQL